MKTIKLTPFQHLIKPEAIIPLQIGNLYRCRTYAIQNDEYLSATWTVSHNSIYRATYTDDGRLHLVNEKTGCYFCAPMDNAGSFGLWKLSKYERSYPGLVYIFEPK